MKELIIKEWKLAVHPTSIIFIFLASMVLIPNYPYCIVFFYSCLGTFFICLAGRENRDIYYSMLLPISKKAIVKSRLTFVMILQIAQILVTLIFILIKGKLLPGENAVGMDASTALLGFGFLLFSIFNGIFFTQYYKNPEKTGKAFLFSCIFVMIFIALEETSTVVIPFVKNYLDTTNVQFLGYQIIFIFISILIYCFSTIAVYQKSKKSFEKLDL